MNPSDSRKQRYEQLPPSEIPPDYYDFSFYVSKERMITYWHQVEEILAKKPSEILEVGIGNGIVAAVLKRYGIAVTTADINESLNPDVVTSLLELDQHFDGGAFGFVLCARVLQHLPFTEFDKALAQLRNVTATYLLLTLPVETLRFYCRVRVTGGKPVTISIPFPLVFKKFLHGLLRRHFKRSEAQNFWKINQAREVSMTRVKQIIEKNFVIEKSYQVPEDMSHAVFLLRKK